MAEIEDGEHHEQWNEGAYSRTQEFRLHLSPVAMDPYAIVERMDALVNERTRAAGFGLLRWDGGALMLGGLCVLRFGVLERRTMTGVTAAVGRAILGGVIARRPGGAIWYAVRAWNDETVLVAGLSDFFPRLPRFAFDLIQAPLHRATISRARPGTLNNRRKCDRPEMRKGKRN